MRGFVLAAGFGTRLRPLTDHLPKALVPVAGRSLLQHSLEFLAKNGISDYAVNAHYLPDAIRQFQQQSEITFELFVELPEILGTGGAIYNAAPFLGGDDTFAVVNADIVADFDLGQIISKFESGHDLCRLIAFRSSGKAGSIVYKRDTGRYCGTPAETGTISGDEASADFIGMALYRKAFLPWVTSADFSIVPVWKRAADAGVPITVQIVDEGYWCDTGTPQDLAKAHFAVIDGRLPLPVDESLRIDQVRRCCFPAGWGANLYDRLEPYCWIEDVRYVPPAGLTHTVVFNKSKPVAPLYKCNVLLTPWGEIPFYGT